MIFIIIEWYSSSPSLWVGIYIILTFPSKFFEYILHFHFISLLREFMNMRLWHFPLTHPFFCTPLTSNPPQGNDFKKKKKSYKKEWDTTYFQKLIKIYQFYQHHHRFLCNHNMVLIKWVFQAIWCWHDLLWNCGQFLVSQPPRDLHSAIH